MITMPIVLRLLKKEKSFSVYFSNPSLNIFVYYYSKINDNLSIIMVYIKRGKLK